MVFDYVVRQGLSGTHVTYGVLKQVACPRPETFAETPPGAIGPWPRGYFRGFLN